MLTIEEILSTDDITELKDLYSDRGISFSKDSFLEVVKKNWDEEKRKILMEAYERSLESIPDKIPPHKVGNYSIFGVTHDKNLKAYYNIVQNTLRSHQPWVFEENLREVFSYPHPCIELPDHSCKPVLKQIKDIYVDIWRSAKQSLQRSLARYKKREYQRDAILHSRSLIMLNVPPEIPAWHTLPPYVEIQTQRLNYAQKRSGYMAEILRHLCDANILVGAYHTHEIDYFLRHPIQDSRIERLATEHAHILMNHPERWNDIKKSEDQRRYKYLLYANICTSSIGGMILLYALI